MSNDAYGTMKVAAGKKETLDRLLRIMNYEDDEYYVDRVRLFAELGEPYEKNGLWCQDFEVDGCNDTEHFFSIEEDKGKLLVTGFEKKPDGSKDYDRPIHGTAHLTNLVELAKALDFGCEVFAEEPNCGFCEHILCDHLGDVNVFTDDIDYKYPLDEDGKENEDAEPEVVYGITGFNDFSDEKDIYGD